MKEQIKFLTLKNKLLLLLVVGFVVLFALGVKTYAASNGPFVATYDGRELYYYTGDFMIPCDSTKYNGRYMGIDFNFEYEDDVVGFVYVYDNTLYVCSFSKVDSNSFIKSVYYTDGTDPMSGGSSLFLDGKHNGTYDTHLVDTTFYPHVTDMDAYIEVCRDYYENVYEPPIEVPVLMENFSLTGFSCDNTITATWTGVSGCPIVDKTDVEVLIQPSYLYIINSGDELQSWDEPDDIVVNYNDMSFYKAYEEFMEGNPYNGSCYFYLSFTPQVMIEGQLYKGSTIRVSYELDGGYSSADIPSAGLPLLYSDFYLKHFTYLEDKNALASVNGSGHNIKFMWNGPSFGDSIDYITSDVKIEIYTMAVGAYDNWGWVTYEPSYHVGIDKDYVRFNLFSLDEELRKERRTIFNKDSVSYAGVYFRFTPYYKTSEANYYGRSIYVRLSRNGSVLSCTQSMGDDSSEDNPGYENVVENMEDNSLMGDLLDDIFDPSDDDGDFSVDDLTLNFFSLLQGLISSLGQFPSLFSAVFSFLPDYYISMLVVGLSMIILLRILGR